MIELTALNGGLLVINPVQIECIQAIPETKIIMMNGKYHIVLESPHEVAIKTVEFYRNIRAVCLCSGPLKMEDKTEKKE